MNALAEDQLMRIRGLLAGTGVPFETGERFTVKRYRSRKTQDENGWRHVEITLEPLNRDFEPIVMVADDEPEVGVVAELLEVLGPALDMADRPYVPLSHRSR